MHVARYMYRMPISLILLLDSIIIAIVTVTETSTAGVIESETGRFIVGSGGVFMSSSYTYRSMKLKEHNVETSRHVDRVIMQTDTMVHVCVVAMLLL